MVAQQGENKEMRADESTVGAVKLSIRVNMRQYTPCAKEKGCDRVKVELFAMDSSVEGSEHPVDEEHQDSQKGMRFSPPQPLVDPQVIQMANASSLYVVNFTFDQTPPSQFLVQLTKITECLVGSIEFYGADIQSNGVSSSWVIMKNQRTDKESTKTEHEQQSIQSSSSRTTTTQRRIEVYGDSLTCGYGILGKDPCPFSSQTEDCTKTYASLLSQSFDAGLSMVCVSGIGLLHSYGSDKVISPVNQYKLLPQSIAADNSSSWNFSLYQPDLVMIYLGANDFSTQPQPSGELWMDYYVKYLDKIWGVYGRNKFPQKFALLCGAAAREHPWCDYVKQIAERWNSVSQAPEAHVLNVAHIQKRPEMDGCNTHPNTEANRLIFENLRPKIQEIMGWD